MDQKPLLTEETTNNAIKIRYEMRQGENLVSMDALELFSDITVRFVEIDGFVRLLLEIGDKATHQNIREAIPNILMWRDQLFEKQSDKIGHTLLKKIIKPSNKDELLESYSYLQENGAKYSDLATHFNQLVTVCLQKHWEYRQKSSITTNELMTMNLSLKYAKNLLKAMGISDQDTSVLIQSGLERLSNREAAFDKGYPISRLKMIEILRTWRKGKLHNSVAIAIKKARSIKE